MKDQSLKKQAKVATSILLSPEALEMRERLAQYFGISRGAIMEMAVRELYRKTYPNDFWRG